MGQIEPLCILCCVSFCIGRVRTPAEPIEAAWRADGGWFVAKDDYGPICDESTGCKNIRRRERVGDDGVEIEDAHNPEEHLAGPGCCCTDGYSGCRISVEEMKGCRQILCLVQKSDDWQPEADDEDFEADSDCFLTGIGEPYSLDWAESVNITPVRHGIDTKIVVWSTGDLDHSMSSLEDEKDLYGMPLHPTCFEIFKLVSKQRIGRIDIDLLWNEFWNNPEFIWELPRGCHVSGCHDQFWHHEPGSEYLVANPVEVPGLHLMPINRFPVSQNGSTIFWTREVKQTSNDNEGATETKRDDAKPRPSLETIPPELQYMLLDLLSSRDIANLRLASRAFQSVPQTVFHRLLLEELPWYWEATDLPAAEIDWYSLYEAVKHRWIELKGLKNRKRIWQRVEAVVKRLVEEREEAEAAESDRSETGSPAETRPSAAESS